MISNRIFVALFGAAFLGLAAYHLASATDGVAGVVFPALFGLFLVNLALRRRHHGGPGLCAGRWRGPASGAANAEGR